MANGNLLSMIAQGGNFAPVSSYYKGLADRQATQLAQQKAQSEAMYKQVQQQNLLTEMAKRQADIRTAQLQQQGMNNLINRFGPESLPGQMLAAGQKLTEKQLFPYLSPQEQSEMLRLSESGRPTTTIMMPGQEKLANEQAVSVIRQAEAMAEEAKNAASRVEIYDQLLDIGKELADADNPQMQGSLLNRANRLAASANLGANYFGDTANSQRYEALTGELVQQELRKNTGVQTEGDAIRTGFLIGNIDTDPNARRELHQWRRSRAHLNGELAMAGVELGYGSDNPEQIRKGWVDLLRLKNELPAVIEEQDGVTYFTDYMRAVQAAGGSRSDALKAWTERYRKGLRK